MDNQSQEATNREKILAAIIIIVVAIFVTVTFCYFLTINSPAVKKTTDLYWVGDSGHPEDPNHWSYTSGGEPIKEFPKDPAYIHFDSNSFSSPGQVVTIDENH